MAIQGFTGYLVYIYNGKKGTTLENTVPSEFRIFNAFVENDQNEYFI